jgi:exodeoxyribonuclease V alpha subunit
MPVVELRRVTVKTVTFHNPDNGWSVLRMLRPGDPNPFTAVGGFPRLAPGETLDIRGEWIRHETFGEQFRADAYRLAVPEGNEAIERYLGGGAIKGIGPVLAKKIVDRFGEDTFDVLDNAPERLDEVPALRGRRKEKILEAWRESKGIREVMFFLQAHNLSLGLSHRLIRQYGPGAAEIIKANPYRLADEVWGIGFLKADDVARKLEEQGRKLDEEDLERALAQIQNLEGGLKGGSHLSDELQVEMTVLTLSEKSA